MGVVVWVVSVHVCVCVGTRVHMGGRGGVDGSKLRRDGRLKRVMSFWAKTPHRPRRCPLFGPSQRPAEGRNFLGDGVGDGVSSPFSTSIHTRAKGGSRHAGVQ